MRQVDAPKTVAKIDLVQLAGLGKMRPDRIDERVGQHSHAVLLALRVSHEQLLFARWTSSSQGRSIFRPSRYKKRIACSAWFCVEAATWCCVARSLRNAVSSGAP